MDIALISLYVWASIWTGLIASRLYYDVDDHRILGSIMWGIGWPIFLPLVIFGVPSPWHMPPIPLDNPDDVIADDRRLHDQVRRG